MTNQWTGIPDEHGDIKFVPSQSVEPSGIRIRMLKACTVSSVRDGVRYVMLGKRDLDDLMVDHNGAQQEMREAMMDWSMVNNGPGSEVWRFEELK